MPSRKVSYAVIGAGTILAIFGILSYYRHKRFRNPPKRRSAKKKSSESKGTKRTDTKQPSQLTENQKKSEEIKEIGKKAFKENQIEEAISLFSEAIRLDPSSYLAYGNRAISYIKLKRYEEGQKDAEEMIRLQPETAKGYHLRGLCLFETGNLDQARFFFNKALQLDPFNVHVKKRLLDVDRELSRRSELKFRRRASEYFEGMLLRQASKREDQSPLEMFAEGLERVGSEDKKVPENVQEMDEKKLAVSNSVPEDKSEGKANTESVFQEGEREKTIEEKESIAQDDGERKDELKKEAENKFGGKEEIGLEEAVKDRPMTSIKKKMEPIDKRENLVFVSDDSLDQANIKRAKIEYQPDVHENVQAKVKETTQPEFQENAQVEVQKKVQSEDQEKDQAETQKKVQSEDQENFQTEIDENVEVEVQKKVQSEVQERAQPEVRERAHLEVNIPAKKESEIEEVQSEVQEEVGMGPKDGNKNIEKPDEKNETAQETAILEEKTSENESKGEENEETSKEVENTTENSQNNLELTEKLEMFRNVFERYEEEKEVMGYSLRTDGKLAEGSEESIEEETSLDALDSSGREESGEGTQSVMVNDEDSSEDETREEYKSGAGESTEKTVETIAEIGKTQASASRSLSESYSHSESESG